MPLSPQSRPRRPHATPVNPSLTKGDQNLTEVDARLTKVDKGCQKLTPSTPAPTPNPSKTQQNRTRALHPNTPSVNPRCQPLRQTPNNPEQIRTNLNKPEHRRTPRPDREAARITPQHPEKKKPQTPSAPPTRAVPACAGMTGRGAGMTVGGRRNDGTGGAGMTGRGAGMAGGESVLRAGLGARLVASHPPPSLPPKRSLLQNSGSGACARVPTR